MPRLKTIYDTEITTKLMDKLSLKNKHDVPKIEKIILIDVPTKVYPEIRKIFIFMFENSGFKDIKISKEIDFQKLHSSRKIQ